MTSHVPFVAVLVCALTCAACSDSPTSPGDLVGIRIQLPAPSFLEGATGQALVVGVDARGRSVPLDGPVAFRSTDSASVKVTESGQISAAKIGRSYIVATYHDGRRIYADSSQLTVARFSS